LLHREREVYFPFKAGWDSSCRPRTHLRHLTMLKGFRLMTTSLFRFIISTTLRTVPRSSFERDRLVSRTATRIDNESPRPYRYTCAVSKFEFPGKDDVHFQTFRTVLAFALASESVSHCKWRAGQPSVVVLGFPFGHDLVAIGPASAPLLLCGANSRFRDFQRADRKHRRQLLELHASARWAPRYV